MEDALSDAAYFLRRAREEACLALAVEEPAIAAAHHGLSVEYQKQARRVLIAEDDAGLVPAIAQGGPAFPQLAGRAGSGAG